IADLSDWLRDQVAISREYIRQAGLDHSISTGFIDDELSSGFLPNAYELYVRLAHIISRANAMLEAGSRTDPLVVHPPSRPVHRQRHLSLHLSLHLALHLSLHLSLHIPLHLRLQRNTSMNRCLPSRSTIYTTLHLFPHISLHTHCTLCE
ncbi:MAG: hypothetical protein SGPRY_008846, partial [Prymnesium sp.]